ncbi:hypothetical protein TL16_g12778 [Triparma laevis f. inornata]|uniref:Uncharacterized protein n=1 Tax=Triparma laevis f. inornata TaxID=1714386 RepID=A0A9W7BT59_9STRA|nr:hypothetical protein TL16_g12778 [Triparma laevis f. inornata]
MASLPAPAFMSPPNLKPKFSTPVALAAVITPAPASNSSAQHKVLGVLPANPSQGQFQLVLKTPSRNIKNLDDFMSSGPLTDPGQGRGRGKRGEDGDGSFLSSASPHHTNTNGKSSRGRSARAIARSARSKNSYNIAAISQSYQSNPFRSASVKKDMSNTLRRSQLPSKPAFSSFNRGSAKKRPNLTTLNGYSSSPNLISPENDENVAPNTTHIPSPSSSKSPGKLALNPLEVPKKNSQQKGKRPNPNARMPKQSQSTYKQQLLGMENKSTQSASKVVLSSGESATAPVEEMRTSARNLFKDSAVSTPSPGKKTPKESPLFKQVDSNERNRRRGVEKGTLELEFEEAGSATPGSSGSKHKPKDMMTKQITREELLQFMDNEGTEEVDAEMDEAISNIDIDETVAVLLSPTKKRRTPKRKSAQKLAQEYQHITPTVNLMSQKITPEVLNSLLVIESDEGGKGGGGKEEDDTARMIDMDDGETSEEEEEEDEGEEELIGSSIDIEDSSDFPSSTDLMRKKFMPEDFSSINDEDIEEEVIDGGEGETEAEVNPMRVSRTFSEASEVEEDEGDDFAKEPKLDEKMSSGEIKQLMSDFGRGEGKEEEEEEDSDDEVSLGGVFAGDIQMLGPWNDLDEYDVMYKVPLDVNGKVKRRRRRNRHRFRPFHMSLWSIPESDVGVPMRPREEEEKEHRRPSAPTVEDILYGSGGGGSKIKKENKPPSKSKAGGKKKSRKSSKNRIQEVITNSKPKTPTKARAPRFNRRSQKIVKSNGEEVAARGVADLGGTIDLGKTSSKLTIGNDTYGQWFAEQIGWGDDDDEEKGLGFDKGEIIALFGCIEGKDFSGLSLALLGEDGEDDCSLFHDVRDDYGNTLLMACCHCGFKRGVKLFVKNGWDLNARNKYGNTALHFAWERGQHKIAEYLKKKGSDEEMRNEMGLTCYERVGVDDE